MPLTNTGSVSIFLFENQLGISRKTAFWIIFNFCLNSVLCSKFSMMNSDLGLTESEQNFFFDICKKVLLFLLFCV